MRENVCRRCRYWEVDPQDVRRGFCHGQRPEALVMQQQGGQLQIVRVFPPTAGDDWCAQWGSKSRRGDEEMP